MEIIFLGTGGGRINLIEQERGTGGFRIIGDINFHVDPGPNALAQLHKAKIDPKDCSVLIITHRHVDHCNDANVILEAMTDYTRKKDGEILIATRNCLFGDDKAVTSYHQRLPSRIEILEEKEIEINFGNKSAKVIPKKAIHDEKTARGFILEMGGKKVGYTTDTEYFKGLGEQYKGVDLLILNVLRPENKAIPGHMDREGAILTLNEAKPRYTLINHMGMEFTKEVLERELGMIRKRTGCRVDGAEDFMRIRV